ncbi:hypothetical protein HanOQP8_Chr13g0500081 [Helianthus annuus]|nr:hypothetical protein HanOQP8_Chr13g0500081 [Helianthus annuus]
MQYALVFRLIVDCWIWGLWLFFCLLFGSFCGFFVDVVASFVCWQWSLRDDAHGVRTS